MEGAVDVTFSLKFPCAEYPILTSLSSQKHTKIFSDCSPSKKSFQNSRIQKQESHEVCEGFCSCKQPYRAGARRLWLVVSS